MRRVTYTGTADRYRVEDRHLPRGVPVDLPNHLADKAARNPDVTVEDDGDTDAAAGGEGETGDLD